MLDREAVARNHSPERSLVEPAGVFIVAGNVAEQRLLEPVEGPGFGVVSTNTPPSRRCS
jgi:hypothetical protein